MIKCSDRAERPYGSPERRRSCFAAALSFTLIGLTGAAVGTTSGERTFGFVVLAAWSVVTVLVLRVSVRLDDQEVVIRGLVRTRRIKRHQLRRAHVVVGDAVVPSHVLELLTHDGDQIRPGGLGDFRLGRAPERLKVARFAEAANEWLRESPDNDEANPQP